MVFFVLVPALPEELFDNAVVTLTLDLTSRRWPCAAFGAEGLGWRGAGVEGFRGLGFRGLRFKHFVGRSSQLARMKSPFLQKGLPILLLKLSDFIYCICIIIAPPKPCSNHQGPYIIEGLTLASAACRAPRACSSSSGTSTRNWGPKLCQKPSRNPKPPNPQTFNRMSVPRNHPSPGLSRRLPGGCPANRSPRVPALGRRVDCRDPELCRSRGMLIA